jgi:hypothetical protein
MRERDRIDLVPPPRVGVINDDDREKQQAGYDNDTPQHGDLEGDTA